MDILAQTPVVTFSPAPHGAPSLVELRMIKATWLQEAIDGGHLDAARLVCQTLGDPFKPDYRPAWQAYRWQPGAGVEIVLYLGCGRWIPARGAYDTISILTAYVDGRQVVYYRRTEYPGEPQPDNYFVPGDWLNVLYAHLDQARETERGRSCNLVERDRRALLAQLLIGLEV